MEWLWTWGGRCFGYRHGDDLWTHDGRHVGRFHRDEVYGPDGRYLGELMNGERLIMCRSKAGWRQGAFSLYSRRVGFAKYVNYVGYVMYAGYQDFPEL
jgi:hypothetical protein